MSTTVKVPFDADNKKIYFVYNFSQVDDFIMIVMFNNQAQEWQQFVINYADGRWETDLLSDVVEDKIFTLICRKLEIIFYERAHHRKNEDFPNIEDINSEAEFLLSI